MVNNMTEEKMIDNVTEDVEVGTEQHTVTIPLYLELTSDNTEATFDYTVDIDDCGQIVIVPKDIGAAFTHHNIVDDETFAEEVVEGRVKKFPVTITANMIGETDNFDYFIEIDEIGQIVITPELESTSFLTASVNDSLDLVTEEKELIEAVEDTPVEEPDDKQPGETVETDVEAKVVDEAYNIDTVYEHLRELTFNFAAEKGELRSVYKSEVDAAAEALAKEYDTVNRYEVGEWYVVEYSSKKQPVQQTPDVITEDIDADEFDRLEELTNLVIDDLDKLLHDAVEKVEALQRNFRKMGVTSADIDRNFKQRLQAFIDSDDDISLTQLKNRVTEHKATMVEESVESEPLEESFDETKRLEVIHKFMTGELAPHEATEVDSSWHELKDLEYSHNGTTYKYFYDEESNSITFVKE